MDKAAYRQEIKLRLTGGILDLELSDETIDKIIDAALREVQRYICTTKVITIPYESCIDMSDYKVNAVVGIYRTEGYLSSDDTGSMDPMQIAQWQLLSGVGNLYNFQNYISNYISWNTLLQLRNTTSTDLAYRYDKTDELLYINISSGTPSYITIEYIPRYDSVEEITSDYWIDVLMRLAVALTKVTVGRVRSKFTQNNALWTLDGREILSEGQQELDQLREHLVNNSYLYIPID